MVLLGGMLAPQCGTGTPQLRCRDGKRKIPVCWNVNTTRTRAGCFVAAGVAFLLSNGVAMAATTSTPYSQIQDGMEIGLLNGKIRACPSDINPNCVSTSSKYGTSSALPWAIRNPSGISPIEEIEAAILSTEKNTSILEKQSSKEGDYLAAEVDGFLGRDVIEFLVKGQTVTFRSMAKKVVYVYPLTTPLTDFGRQQSRIKTLEDKLGWRIDQEDEKILPWEY